MKNLLALTLTAGLATAAAQTATTTVTVTPVVTGLTGVELGLTGGYANGLSGEVFVHVPNIAGPFGVKAGVAVTRAADAINDASPVDPTGIIFPTTYTFGQAKAEGDASESGSHTIFSLDGTYNVGEVSPGLSTTLYAGGRYGMFRATEVFNEQAVDYRSNSFGIGAGVMLSYALTGNLSLVGDLGVDQFFRSSITATDADGNSDTFNPGEGGYEDINNRVVRPGTVFKARIGIKTTF